MKAGDTILFRGRRRLVVFMHPGGLCLERVNKSNKYGHPIAWYSAGQNEIRSCQIARLATPYTKRKARKLWFWRYPTPRAKREACSRWPWLYK